jgi:hypothetical protein
LRRVISVFKPPRAQERHDREASGGKARRNRPRKRRVEAESATQYTAMT